MHQVPEIRTNHPAIAVEAMVFRAPLFGVFGTPGWEVRWRSSEDPRCSGTSIVPHGTTKGRAELDGQSFTYSARWHDTSTLSKVPTAAEDPHGHIVTPGGVLRLAEFSSHQ